jgi:serine/threonine protein kinase/Tol biopolymer transport system component
MKAEQWQELDRLFQAALERTPEERPAFLEQACSGDERLLREVEELLAAHEQAGSFIERPAMEVEARAMANEQGDSSAASLVGQAISHYRIIAALGSGGMGEVYLAQDTVLGRKVALKLLPSEFTRDAERVRRFQQEARAASALNHPNIITIYEIGRVDDRHFITTEFIDGETLRQRIKRSQTQIAVNESRTSGVALGLGEVLNIAVQAADALAAAHEAGIVHRDIKPENIMVRRRDGYAKVLDFGLAKLTEGPAATVDTEAPTKAKVQTIAGMVMGTANYMSPEQARGERVDSRTDLWSLGVVLYEMVAGKAPFVGVTTTDLLAAILFHEPPSLLLYRGDLPEELERIVSKTLTKDREKRYQTAEDLLSDLRRLLQRLELEAEIERLATPGSGAELEVTTDSARPAVPAADEISERTDEGAARPTSSAEYVVGEIRRHKLGTLIALAIILLAVGGIGFRLYRLFTHQELKPAHFQTMKIKRLTNSGNATSAAISPDGKYVAYVLREVGRDGLHVKQVETTSDIEIVPPEMTEYGGLTFSPDGNYLLFVKSANGASSDLYQVPTLGSVPRKLLADISSYVSFSPDGKRFAFVRRKGRECGLMVANADGTGTETLATHQEPDCLSDANNGPAWSPDGKVIAYPIWNADRHEFEVIGVDVEHGTEINVSSKKWKYVGRLAWLSDGSGLMLTAHEGDPPECQVWLLDYPGGKLRRLTADSNKYLELTLSADSNSLATVQIEQRNNLWLAPGNDAKRARQLTQGAGKYELTRNVSWTPDGKILYSSRASGNWDIWIMDEDGRNQRQLTVDTRLNFAPFATPDGSQIVFATTREGAAPHIWRMEIDGSNPKQLTNGPGLDESPKVTPDGKWVVYQKRTSDPFIYKVSIEGGTPVPLTDKHSEAPAVSPDGKLVACIYWSNPGSQPQIALLPIEGGPPVKLFEIPPTSSSSTEWTPDGRALAYVDTRGGVSNIWRLPIDGRPPTQLTDFKSDLIFNFAWSRDGKQLVLTRGSMISDVVLIHDLRDQR